MLLLHEPLSWYRLTLRALCTVLLGLLRSPHSLYGKFLPSTALRLQIGLVSCKKSLPLSFFISLSDLWQDTYIVQWDSIVINALCIYSCIIEWNFPSMKNEFEEPITALIATKILWAAMSGKTYYPLIFKGFGFLTVCIDIFRIQHRVTV